MGKNPIQIARVSKTDELLNSYTVVQRTTASSRYNTKDVDTNISVRPSFGRDNYEYFREKETLPRNHKDVMMFCQVAYKTVGMIKNIIDLMSDFSSDGIKFVHPNSKIEKFYREWWAKIAGPTIAERFLNYFYRLGTVPVRRMTAKLKTSDVEKIYRAFGSDIGSLPVTIQPEKREIPWKYVFLNPMTIEPLSELGSFVGRQQYGVRINEKILKKIKSPTLGIDSEFVNSLPADLINSVRKGDKVVPLDPNKNFFYFYKKDDWEDFGSPMIAPLMDDILLLEKLRLADAAACDGAISQVRLWTVGDLKEHILPSKEAIQKVADMLTNHVGGGSFDMVWGPELKFQESTTSIHNFLGKEKYEPTLNNIYAGLGIPPTLTGAATSGGFTNNYISLKTLIERLDYGRETLKLFIEQEVEFIRAAMGFRFPAKVIFDRMTLADEASEKALLLQLVDRDIISAETVLERFDELPELEKARLKREYKLRDADKLPPKRGPYSSPDDDFMKMFIQSGVISPSEAGVGLLPRKAKEKSPIEYNAKMQRDKALIKSKDRGGKGRPLGQGDSGNRKSKVVKPRASASKIAIVSSWARDAYNNITSVILPIYLKKQNKSNARGLTVEEFDILEDIKFNVLCSIEPLTKVDDECVMQALSKNMLASKDVLEVYNNLVDKFKAMVNPIPTIDDLRNLRICAYSIIINKGDCNG